MCLWLRSRHQSQERRHPGNGAQARGSIISYLSAADRQPSSITGARQLVQDVRRKRNESLHNAVLSAEHTSTTESVLAWPYFDIYHSLRSQYQPIFAIEQQRSKFGLATLHQLPFLDRDEAQTITKAFQDVLNFSYPTVLATILSDVEHRILKGPNDDSIESCLALLIMALGCACRVVQSLNPGAMPSSGQDQQIIRSRLLAQTYFELYLQRLSVVHLEVSTTSTQCLFFTALFFAYLQRPLQAWSYISMTAAKCRLLLSYASADTGVDTECLRRIFWSCFILESDYIAELAALPQTGVSDMESLVPYPAFYQTSEDDIEREHSSLYFLACVSMRRLLNRVHDLLYAPETGVAFDDARFPHIVAELDHQLEEWRKCLPPFFRFTIDESKTETQHGGFLRQRYLTCRAVIYRPFLNQVLSKASHGELVGANILDKSEVCLRMCLLHILNLRAFSHTVLVDTWICSLSMASTMLLLLAASRISDLKARLNHGVLSVGKHLLELIEPWTSVHGDQKSPSVRQSLWMISEIDALLHQVLANGT
ncbi:hypothetical protein AC578_6882 [Pseudocercospora eumusae]|uniref:Xylanolytic transcriptional activator regulatory domain-containing protein n=1 Tax=Pseudocercospora eumusae TaxID=321146 RepID=A0A139H9U0_9PEZI|nr:hypothetical protein AC578_6882 [Pseudocercospora eumusae]